MSKFFIENFLFDNDEVSAVDVLSRHFPIEVAMLIVDYNFNPYLDDW